MERDAEPFIWDGYDMQVKVLDNVCLMDAYDLPPEQDVIQINSYLFTPEGEIPFEVGKTYLVRGRYWDYTIDDLGYQTVTDEAGNEVIEFVRGRDIEYGFRQLIMEGQADLVDGMSTPGKAEGVQNFIYDIHEDSDTGLIYFSTPKNGCWPYFAEYDGDWQDFLASDDGRVWREEIIPNFEMNHASAPVILTDNIDSLYLFNTGDASMLFLLLFARRVSAVMRSMRLLGVPKKGVWLESLGMLVMQELNAVILGNGLAVVLYDRITAQLLAGTPAIDPASIVLCAGVKLAVLVAAGSIWMHRIAGENLMQNCPSPKRIPALSGA